ncbi:hypothetical protein RCL1_004024 [Eukaryota sp. TZLM3-RCL]
MPQQKQPTQKGDEGRSINPKLFIHHDPAVMTMEQKKEWDYDMRIPDYTPEDPLPDDIEERAERVASQLTDAPPAPILGETEPIRSVKQRFGPVRPDFPTGDEE